MPVQADPKSLTFESDVLSLAPTAEKLAVSAAGRFSSAQVYFIGPDSWLGSSPTFRVYGRTGGGRLLLSQSSLAASKYTTESGTTTALVAALRGVPVEGLEVTIQQPSPTAPELSNGRIVVVASDHADGAQGLAAPPAGRWPVYLSDGDAAVGSLENALPTRKSDRRAAYYASASVLTSTSTETDKSILYVFNATGTKRAEIRRVTINYLAGDGDAQLTVRGSHITAVPSPAGGTSVAGLPFDPSDASSSMTVVAGGNTTTNVGLDLILFMVPFTATGTFVWTWTDLGKPIVLPPSPSRGFEIRIDTTASYREMTLQVCIEWLEI